ncbi:MAG: hypothetical protein LPK45_04665, partial [Bacteroidota bacterium]|nr:hypothetical protein [Bacteroidota bacterium]MDX5430348.1 hypothetical protein [Bacteroidota bacterium]MDX5469109.1 hypothetical protein [Bacteroidota bacterium]
VNGREIFDYQVKNGYRLDYYLRFDVAYSNTKQNQSGLKQEFILGIYNLLNRNNPYFLYLANNPNGPGLVAKEVSLFPFLPSIHYRLSF